MGLADKFGVVVHTPSENHIQALSSLGFTTYRVTLEWPFFEKKPGQVEFGWADALMSMLHKYTGVTPLVSIAAFPKWLDPSYQGDTPALPYFKPEWTPLWEKFVDSVVSRYPEVKLWGIIMETNIKGWWTGTPDQFYDWVLLPAANIIHSYGKEVVAPGTTILEYSKLDPKNPTANFSFYHFKTLLDLAGKNIDVVDIHSYSSSGSEVFPHAATFCSLANVMDRRKVITETGFSYEFKWNSGEPFFWNLGQFFSSGQARQLARYQKMMGSFSNGSFQGKPFSSMFEQIYLYHGWDPYGQQSDPNVPPPANNAAAQIEYTLKLLMAYYGLRGGAGILESDLSLKKAAEYLKSIL